MTTEFWLLISSLIFVFIVFKPVKNSANNFIETVRNAIKSEISEAENIFLDAKEKLKEAKTLYAELGNTKELLIEKENKEIEFDINERQKEFTDLIKTKNEQLETQISREILKFKNSTISHMSKELKVKLIEEMAASPELEETYMQLSLKEFN